MINKELHTLEHTNVQEVNLYFGTLVKKKNLKLQQPRRAIFLTLSHLEEPVEGLSDQRPAHGALRQRQVALFVPRQAPAEAPQLPGQRQQQERGQHRGERSGQGR